MLYSKQAGFRDIIPNLFNSINGKFNVELIPECKNCVCISPPVGAINILNVHLK